MKHGKGLLEIQGQIAKLSTERSQLWQGRYQRQSPQARRVGTIEVTLADLYEQKRRARAQ